MEKGLLEKSGKPLEHWIKIVQKAKLGSHKEIIDFLKAKHSFTYGFANFVALKARKSDAASHDSEDLVANQYKGKESLKPIYERLISRISKMGADITITPKKDSVSMIRKKQFALIKPATKTRIDLGLKFKSKATTKRLENSGPFGSMCTHRVQVTALSEIDTELLGWIEEAYEGAN